MTAGLSMTLLSPPQGDRHRTDRPILAAGRRRPARALSDGAVDPALMLLFAGKSGITRDSSR
jgi:hypothetical protein